jgi:septum formation protein
MPPLPLILASKSPRRQAFLRHLGLAFEVVAADIPEVHYDHLTPHELCQLNAYRKARAVAKQLPDALVLGADTLVCLGQRLLGKPRDLTEAEQMLGQLAGRPHEVVTGVCLVHLRSHRQRTFAESTTVTFRPLSLDQIRRYLQQVDPLDKAGAYAIQEHGELIVERIDGSFANVVGLPIERVQRELDQFQSVAP